MTIRTLLVLAVVGSVAAGCSNSHAAEHPSSTTVASRLPQIFDIPSDAMAPTLMAGDKVSVIPGGSVVARGDIVVFRAPPGVDQAATDLIKRVIGLPGETISSGANGSVLINGRPIAEPWLSSSAKTDPGSPIPETVIPMGQFYVLGDNRGDSLDSRTFGAIPEDLLIGTATGIVYPPNRVAKLTP